MPTVNTPPLPDSESRSIPEPSLTLAASVYARIRNDLISGRYTPGAVLTLRGLADELGTSITPIRESIFRLAAERALVVSPNRSITVPDFDRAELTNLWRLRILVESDACRLAAVQASDEMLDRIEGLLNVAIDHLRRRDVVGVRTNIAAAGLLIAEASGSDLMFNIIGNLRTLSGPHIALALDRLGETAMRSVEASIELTHITIRALKRRDADSAAAARCVDLQSFREVVLGDGPC